MTDTTDPAALFARLPLLTADGTWTTRDFTNAEVDDYEDGTYDLGVADSPWEPDFGARVDRLKHAACKADPARPRYLVWIGNMSVGMDAVAVETTPGLLTVLNQIAPIVQTSTLLALAREIFDDHGHYTNLDPVAVLGARLAAGQEHAREWDRKAHAERAEQARIARQLREQAKRERTAGPEGTAR